MGQKPPIRGGLHLTCDFQELSWGQTKWTVDADEDKKFLKVKCRSSPIGALKHRFCVIASGRKRKPNGYSPLSVPPSDCQCERKGKIKGRNKKEIRVNIEEKEKESRKEENLHCP